MGQYEYQVMPYGLANSPSVFQSFMYEVFLEMLNHFVIFYIDDIQIFFDSYEQHMSHVKQVLKRQREQNLFTKGEKCEFHHSSLKLLGYFIQPGADPVLSVFSSFDSS